MGCAAIMLIDAILFLFFLMMAIVAPLLDAQNVLPLHYYPKSLVELNGLYEVMSGDYLVIEKPYFFKGLAWFELCITWPLSIACLVGLVSSKPWFNKACLVFGVIITTCMAPIMAELLGSGRASDTMLKIYTPYVGLGVLAVLRGLIPCSSSCTTSSDVTAAAFGKRPVVARKKKA